MLIYIQMFSYRGRHIGFSFSNKLSKSLCIKQPQYFSKLKLDCFQKRTLPQQNIIKTYPQAPSPPLACTVNSWVRFVCHLWYTQAIKQPQNSIKRVQKAYVQGSARSSGTFMAEPDLLHVNPTLAVSMRATNMSVSQRRICPDG